MMTKDRYRARRLARAAMTIAALSLALAAPAKAYQFGSLLKGVGDQVAAHMPAKPAQPAPAPAAAAPPPGAGPMGLQGQAGAPLHKLGTDAVAVVDAATGTTAVRQMDYVFAGKTIALGPKGAITLSYLSGCMSETIQGGTVTVAATGSRVAGGKMQTKATRAVIPPSRSSWPAPRKLARRSTGSRPSVA